MAFAKYIPLIIIGILCYIAAYRYAQKGDGLFAFILSYIGAYCATTALLMVTL